MVIRDGFKEDHIVEEKIFKMLNDVSLAEEEYKDIDVTDEDIKIIKAKVYKNIGIKPKNKIMKRLAIAASIAILLCIPLSNATVWANIKTVLQFIPGIGVVEKTGAGGIHYMLTKIINKSYSNGKIIIRGFDIDNKNATLSIDGDKIPYFNSVEIQDDNGKVYKMNEFASGSYGDSNPPNWNRTYKYSGDIKIGKDYTIILDKTTKIPISLVAVNNAKDLNKLGPTVAIDGFNVTAMTSMEGNKLKLDLLVPQNSGDKRLEYPYTGLSLTDENGGFPFLVDQIFLTDSSGSKYSAYMSTNMSLNGSEYYFKTGNDIKKQYTLTISKILLNYSSITSFSSDLPKNGETSPKQIVKIAGYPVGISILKVNDTKVRVNVDINYNKALKNNLVSFSLSSPSIKNDAVFSEASMKSEFCSSPDYFEFSINKNTKHLNLEFNHPIIEEQGPWNFNIKLK